MTWLLEKLLSIEVPDQAKLDSWEISLRGGLAGWIGILIIVLAAAAVFFLYFREKAPMTALRRLIMAGIRVAAVGLVLLLLMRPVLIAEFKGERPAGIALVLDSSQSMTQKDQRVSPQDKIRVAIAEGLVAPDFNIKDTNLLGTIPAKTSTDPQRADLVRGVLKNEKLKLSDGLERFGPLKAYRVGQKLQAVTPENKPGSKLVDTLLAGYLADEKRTSLADGINDLLQRPDELPAAVVLMTDGRDNASKIPLPEVARECARLKVPLFIYGVGSAEGGNIQLKDVNVPDTIFYEDTVTVRVRWRAQGFKDGKADITLTLGGKVVASKEVGVRDGDDFIDELKFTPEKSTTPEQRHELIATIKFRGNETFTADNDLKRPVRVTDRKVKVLFIENVPRWEYKFLQNGLLRDRRIEAKFLLVQADTEAAQAGGVFLQAFPATRQELFAFDLLILGDVPASFINPERMEWIKDFVSEGGGLIQIAGSQHAPSSYDPKSPLAEIMPVEVLPQKFATELTRRPQAFSPVPTAAGERSEMLALADTPEENPKVWKSLPGMYWHYEVSKLRPGAVALLTHPRKMLGNEPMPLMAIHYFGRGQVLFLGIDETWRWRSQGESKYPGRFWGQIIYHMGLPRLLGNLERVQLALERSQNVVDRPANVYARLFDSEYKPVKPETKVKAKLERLDAPAGAAGAGAGTKEIDLEPIPGQPGEFRALLPNDSAGRFQLKIENPETATLEYRVDLPPRHEMEVAGLAEDALREAAGLSGGKFYREEDLHRMVKEIPERKTPFLHRQEVLLWTPLALMAFVVLMTAEWLVRKFSNLS